MNYIDIIILAVLLVGAVVGASKGIFRQLGSLGGFLIGIIGARLFAAEFSHWLRSVVDLSATTAEIASYVLVFLIVYLSVFALARLLQRITQGVGMDRPVDRRRVRRGEIYIAAECAGKPVGVGRYRRCLAEKERYARIEILRMDARLCTDVARYGNEVDRRCLFAYNQSGG